MNKTTIQIRYGDGFSDTEGCTTISLPDFIDQQPLAKVKGFLKLAAEQSWRRENAEQVLKLEAYLTAAIREAEQEAEAAKAMSDETPEKVKRAEITRTEKQLTRTRKVRDAFTAALDKYGTRKPKRK